jgi:16S rRNA (cytidine1402-2'-O)-methyltransferase
MRTRQISDLKNAREDPCDSAAGRDDAAPLHDHEALGAASETARESGIDADMEAGIAAGIEADIEADDLAVPARQDGARGCLYLVGTPIGNLEDITLRALRILKEVDQIACEDTRHTQKLLTRYDIHKSLVSYHEHNEITRAPELVLAMEEGAKIALVSDAGMPLVSDPGYRLVTICVRHRLPVIPIPGPSALLAALSASGLPNEEFLFVGFLPNRAGERRRALEHLRIEDRTIIFYEAPHRVAETVADAREILGDRHACLAREVTKLHEEFRRGKLSELAQSLAERPARGEITLLIAPEERAVADSQTGTSQSIAARVEELMHQAKLDRKEALKVAARERGLTRRAAYGQLISAIDEIPPE